jgi:hypothetical protein
VLQEHQLSKLKGLPSLAIEVLMTSPIDDGVPSHELEEAEPLAGVNSTSDGGGNATESARLMEQEGEGSMRTSEPTTTEAGPPVSLFGQYGPRL